MQVERFADRSLAKSSFTERRTVEIKSCQIGMRLKHGARLTAAGPRGRGAVSGGSRLEERAARSKQVRATYDAEGRRVAHGCLRYVVRSLSRCQCRLRGGVEAAGRESPVGANVAWIKALEDE